MLQARRARARRRALRDPLGAFSTAVKVTIEATVDALQWCPPLLLIAAIAALAWYLQRSWVLVVGTILSLTLVVNLGYWDETTATLALILYATGLSMLIGVPIGIAAAHRPWLWTAIRPVLDLMQTIPTFVYLIPALVLFGLGFVPGLVATLLAAISWNLITWYRGIPSSSSHALIGGILGAAIAQGGFGAPDWMAVLTKVLLPLVLSPVFGFLFAGFIIVVVLRLFGSAHPATISSTFGRLQLASSAFMAYSHGGNDAQKTMGIMTLALVAYGAQSTFDVPLWVVIVAATAMALGTAAGGWRIIKTMGQKVVKLDPVHGFAAETTAATVITVATHFGMPVSTTHVISSAIMGVGSSDRLKTVRWGVARSIVTAWLVTLPAAGVTAAIAYVILQPLLG